MKNVIWLFLLMAFGCGESRTNKVDVTGKKGDRGEVGPKGDVGPKGESIVCDFLEVDGGTLLSCGENSVLITNGMNGSNGSNGSNGRNGSDGRDGERGERGRDGINGGPGPRGEQGAPGRDGIDGQGCSVVSNHDGSIDIKCGETIGRIPPERHIIICIWVRDHYETRSYPVSQFISEIYGRFRYCIGACGGSK